MATIFFPSVYQLRYSLSVWYPDRFPKVDGLFVLVPKQPKKLRIKFVWFRGFQHAPILTIDQLLELFSKLDNIVSITDFNLILDEKAEELGEILQGKSVTILSENWVDMSWMIGVNVKESWWFPAISPSVEILHFSKPEEMQDLQDAEIPNVKMIHCHNGFSLPCEPLPNVTYLSILAEETTDLSGISTYFPYLESLQLSGGFSLSDRSLPPTLKKLDGSVVLENRSDWVEAIGKTQSSLGLFTKEERAIIAETSLTAMTRMKQEKVVGNKVKIKKLKRDVNNTRNMTLVKIIEKKGKSLKTLPKRLKETERKLAEAKHKLANAAPGDYIPTLKAAVTRLTKLKEKQERESI